MRYKRVFLPGGAFFFTVVTYGRLPILNNSHAINLLRESCQYVMQRHPFTIPAICILPDHIHFILNLPENDSDYPLRIRLMKSYFSHRFQPVVENFPKSRIEKQEKAVWQRRYWEHLIRNERDMENHIDYIHYNPVKHGYVLSPNEWKESSFHHYVKLGLLPEDWGSSEPLTTKSIHIPD